jgi:TolA-binding protein
MSSLENLGARIRAAQDRILASETNTARARSQLSFDPADYPATRGRWKGVVFAAVSAAAAVLLAFLFWLPSSAMELDGQPVSVGDWVAAPPAGEKMLTFSDGSAIRLSANSSARVQHLDARGAHVLLERGVVHVHVRPRGGNAWKMDAGPYRIEVKGTRFQMSWHPREERFELTLEEGEVLVSGPMLKSARPLKAGERMQAAVARHWLEIEDRDSYKTTIHKADLAAQVKDEGPETGPALEETGDEGVASVAKGGAAFEAPAKRQARQGRAATSWQSLAEQGAYDKALAAAEKTGIDRILERSSALTLMTLGDAARRGGRQALAKRVYREVYQRFPRTTHASSAAFALGIIAFDRERQYQTAAKWFEACKTQGGAGTLTREAMGRLVEALHRAGEKRAARQAAVRYLERYPKGPHANLARRIASSN